ncbi:MAG TPA: hypothetical protein VHD60_03640 [Candidatus Saccharimonadales bacterium]|nr:hypothetical protein [Candidatus Saccharimonadales bacterium]
MPSSVEHCLPCAFDPEVPAAVEECAIEDNLVVAHVGALASPDTPHGAMPHAGIAAVRAMAAKECALSIYEGRCPLFTYALNRESGRAIIVRKLTSAS